MIIFLSLKKSTKQCACYTTIYAKMGVIRLLYIFACTYIKSLEGYKDTPTSVAFREDSRVPGGIAVGRKLYNANPLCLWNYEACKCVIY